MTRLLLCGIALACLAPAARAQRPVRIGVTASSISIEDGSGQAHGFPSFGGSLAVITGDDAEMGVTVARYNNLSSDACTRALTFYGVDSYYYPIGPKGVAPFASTEIGLARVTESNPRVAIARGHRGPRGQLPDPPERAARSARAVSGRALPPRHEEVGRNRPADR